MRMLIKNGRVIDPASNTDDIRDEKTMRWLELSEIEG